MRRIHITPVLAVLSVLVVAFGAMINPGSGTFGQSAQDATPPSVANHPIVGTWIVDTVSATDTDSPEIGIFHGDGTMVGLGANRSAGGTWEVIDGRSIRLMLITVSDSNGVGTYVVVRGTHVLDDTGNGWTCDDCAFTVVSADGTVLDSGTAPASAVRMPVQGSEEVGNPLAEVPVWMPAAPMEATPAS